MRDKADILEQFKKHKKLADSRLGDQRENFRKCDAAYNADFVNYQGNVTVHDARGRAKQVMVQINKIKPYIMSIKGFFAQNRRKAEYVARVLDSQEQEAKSEYFNALADYARDNGNADQIETQMDGDMLVRGLGAVETDLTYGDGLSARNPNGEIEWMRLDVMNVGYNPSSRAANLLDSDFTYYHMDYPRQDAYELFDNDDPKDFVSASPADGTALGQPIPGTGGGFYSDIREKLEASDADEDKVRIYFYQWYEIENFYRAPNPLRKITDPMLQAIMMARMTELAGEVNEDYDDADDYTKDQFSLNPMAEVITCDEDTRRKLIEMFDGVEIEFVKHKRRCYYRAVISGEKVFKVAKSPCQKGFTVKFKTGDWDESRKIWHGVVSQMIEPMLYYNKALTELLYAIASGAKGGVLYEESAVDNVAQFEASYARTDSATRVNDGALQNGQIKPKREQYSPNGVEELISLSDNAINDVAGVDKSFLGSSENKLETAALQRQRIKQVTTTLACYVDSIWLYQKENARLLIDLLRIYAANNDGEMFRVMDAETGKVTNQMISVNQLAQDYDVTIVEGPDTATEREERAQLLTTMADRLMAGGDVASAKQIYATAVKYLPIDMSDKQAIRKVLVPEQGQIDPEQVAQMQQALEQATSEAAKTQMLKMQSEAAVNFAKLEEINANIRNKNADSMKKISETDENAAETAALTAMKREELDLRKDELAARREAETARMQLDIMRLQAELARERTAQQEGEKSKAYENILMQSIEKMTMAIQQMQKPRRVLRDNEGRVTGVE